MSESRQPVPSPVLGIVGLVVAAGLITLALRYKSPQTPTNPPANDSTSTSTPPTEQPVVATPPAPEPETPSMLVPEPAQMASMGVQELTSTLASIPEADRSKVATGVLFAAASKNESVAELVPILVGAGADVNSKDEGGRTPLMLSSEAANLGLVFALLDQGADVWVKDAEGMDAREHALARNDKAGYDVAEVLEGAGPD